MRREQLISHRDRDLNTSDQFLKALGVSMIVHLVAVLSMILLSMVSFKPKIIVPGYKVSLVYTQKASSLQRKSVQKKKSPVKVKKRPKNVKVKRSKPKVKKKSPIKGKKIVAKKQAKKQVKKKEPSKTTPKKEKKEVAPPAESIQKIAVSAAGEPFPHTWYLKLVERKVDENWVTHGVDIRTMHRDPVVRFSIARDGSLSNVTMESTSGSAQLDQSAIEAVHSAAPFPTLPEDFSSDSLDVHFGFSYSQHE